MDEVTLKNRPLKHIHKRLGRRIGAHYHQADIDEWFEDFKKKHTDFVNGKIYDWLEANVPKWYQKGCEYMDVLTLFIRKEVLGEQKG